MLKNASFLAIVAVDTAENEPSKVSMKWGPQTGVAPVMYRLAADQNYAVAQVDLAFRAREVLLFFSVLKTSMFKA